MFPPSIWFRAHICLCFLLFTFWTQVKQLITKPLQSRLDYQVFTQINKYIERLREGIDGRKYWEKLNWIYYSSLMKCVLRSKKNLKPANSMGMFTVILILLSMIWEQTPAKKCKIWPTGMSEVDMLDPRPSESVCTAWLKKKGKKKLE